MLTKFYLFYQQQARVSLLPFAAAIGVPVGIASESISLVFSLVTELLRNF